MRKIVATEFVTLDWVMEDPGGQNTFKDNNWHFPFWCDAISQFKFAELKKADALLLGKTTYEGFAEAWPKMEKETGDFGVKMNNMTKYVVSTTLKKADWTNSHIISSNVAEEIKKLKDEPPTDKNGGTDILLTGSNTLFHFCMEHNLIDEYRLMVHPIYVGKGKKLFKEGMPRVAFKLDSFTEFETGVIVLSYSVK